MAKNRIRFFFLSAIFFGLHLNAQELTGIAYLDYNNNEIQDNGEQGIKGVLVSNGKDF